MIDTYRRHVPRRPSVANHPVCGAYVVRFSSLQTRPRAGGPETDEAIGCANGVSVVLKHVSEQRSARDSRRPHNVQYDVHGVV